MKEGTLPPQTGNPEFNEYYDMIDAQLTTEIFGLYAPTNVDVAIEIADLPIKTVARGQAEDISKFYVAMHALASEKEAHPSFQNRIIDLANKARETLEEGTYPAANPLECKTLLFYYLQCHRLCPFQ